MLVIENVQTEHSGYYLCTASLHDQTTAQICRITVAGGRGRKWVGLHVCTYEIEGSTYKNLFRPPDILEEPSEVVLFSPGATVTFRLRVSGNPPPMVQWYYRAGFEGEEYGTETERRGCVWFQV